MASAPLPPPLRPHVVTLGAEGALAPTTAPEDLDALLAGLRGRLLEAEPERRRVVLYAHGALVTERDALPRVDRLRARMLGEDAPLLAFAWRTGYRGATREERGDARLRAMDEMGGSWADDLPEARDERLEAWCRGEGALDGLPPWARWTRGEDGAPWWGELKRNAARAWEPGHGGGDLALRGLDALAREVPGLEVHVAAHGAGALLMGPFVSGWAARGRDVETCTLWAPACRMRLFHEHYAPARREGRLRHLRVCTLTPERELDDRCHAYGKSFLHLVSRGFEAASADAPAPILGLADHLARDDDALRLVDEWVQAPGSPASGARTHGGFEDDDRTLRATRALVLSSRRTRTLDVRTGTEAPRAEEPRD